MNTKDIVIIGAGITGLTTAFYAQKNGKNVLVVERDNAVGGQMRSHRVGNYIFEAGPSTGVVSHPEVAELFEALKGDVEMDVALPSSKCRLIWKGDSFHPLPSGLKSAVTTPLFTLKDKIRILGEPWRKPGTDPNEKVGDMTRRRLGKSFLDYAVDPFLSGVYAGDPMILPTRTALPKLYNLEHQYGSFIRGTIAKAKLPKTDRDRKATKQLFSARGGFGQLTTALARRIGYENIALSATGAKVEPASDGRFCVSYTDAEGNPQQVFAPRVVTTCGAYALPALLPFVEKAEMDHISNLVYAPVIQIGVGISNVENHHYKAFGALMPSKEKKDVLGILFPSACFSGRAPQAGETLAFFIGGVRHPEMLEWTDDQFVHLVDQSIHSLLKYPASVTIDQMRIFRHRHAIPQYQETSDQRYATIETLQRRYPGLVIAGNLRDGIGMGDRIRQGTLIGNSSE